ncbi:MAG: class I SAM-dependent methyltransferase [Alphaproteobacteria bacterium]|nr:class I SAM-dependent methyltransferase [Alphaproteobacteria bacterium]
MVTPVWQAMADQIYAGYDINHQSHGAEPMIFDSVRGSGPRSVMLLRNFLDTVDLPQEGRLLDIGCSNGNLLANFHRLRPDWKLSGAELSDKFKDVILSLPRVEAFYSGSSPAYYAGPYDVISLSHVLEHIPDPAAFLTAVAAQLSANGRILLATPDLVQNPSDLIIADHCTHFDERSLRFVVEKADLTAELLSTSLLPKELVAILSPRRRVATPAMSSAPSHMGKERCLFYFKLLDDVRREARAARNENRPFGIMGSSIAALWTMLELAHEVDFFVDEDPQRVGHCLAGVPILSPAQVADGSLVFIPMSVAVAEKIIGRWRHLPVEFRFAATNRPV